MLQVIATVQIKGKTVDEALTSMKAEQKAVLDKLQKIGIEQKQVKFEELGIDTVQSEQLRLSERLLAQAMQRIGRNPRPSAAAESVELKCMVSIEYPLTGKTAEDILKESHTMRQKIKEANAFPKKVLTPEEEELAEEMEGMMSYGIPSGQNFGEYPRLVYVANLPEESCQKAFAEAFAQAKQQGEFLAKAAGVKLGKLTQFSGGVSGTVGINSFSYPSSQDDIYIQRLLVYEPTNPTRGGALKPDGVEFIVNVHAVFAMER
jgi:hypothetical protein